MRFHNIKITSNQMAKIYAKLAAAAVAWTVSVAASGTRTTSNVDALKLLPSSDLKGSLNYGPWRTQPGDFEKKVIAESGVSSQRLFAEMTRLERMGFSFNGDNINDLRSMMRGVTKKERETGYLFKFDYVQNLEDENESKPSWVVSRVDANGQYVQSAVKVEIPLYEELKLPSGPPEFRMAGYVDSLLTGMSVISAWAEKLYAGKSVEEVREAVQGFLLRSLARRSTSNESMGLRAQQNRQGQSKTIDNADFASMRSMRDMASRSVRRVRSFARQGKSSMAPKRQSQTHEDSNKLMAGMTVTIVGLDAKPQYNGLEGELKEFQDFGAASRWVVKVNYEGYEKELAVKPKNLNRIG